MVKYETETKYRCPYCNSLYDNWDDAWNCATEDCDVECPEDEEITYNVCEFCGKRFTEEQWEEAEKCEEKHRMEHDELFSRHRLKLAGEHPQQMKLAIAKSV